MNESTNDECLFTRGGFFHALLERVGLAEPGAKGIRTRIVSLLLLTYTPLLGLALVQNVAVNPDIKEPFLLDISEATRFLLVVPMLIAAEAIIEPWLIQVIRYTRERLVKEDDLFKYEKLITSAFRLRNSYLVEFILLLGIFCWQWIDAQNMRVTSVTSWHVIPATHEPSYAWHWYALFAKPLTRFLWFRWLWRYLIWSFILFRLGTFDLKLMPTHPDRYGGLFYIAVAHAKFAILSLIFGVQASSILAMQIIHEGKELAAFRYVIIGVVLIVLLLFLTPLLAFTGKLLEAKRKGLFEYGALADEYTTKFRSKWIDAKNRDALLGSSDIQSLADLGNSYEVVREMRVCLIGKDTILTFILAVLLPFSPLLLTVYPFDELLKHFLKVVM